MLNAIWIGFLLVALASGFWEATFGGRPAVLGEMTRASFEMAKTGFEISLGLTGVMTLWLGLLRIGEHAGLVSALTRLLAPLFARLMPEVPCGHPAQGAVTMNMAANVLGLDNAATPLGLQAMRELQSLNPQPQRASDAQILFLVINASSVTLFPLAVFTYRAQLGAADPTDVFLPILIATGCSTLAGLIACACWQRLALWQPVVLAYLGGIGLLLAALVAWVAGEPAGMAERSALLANGALLALIGAFVAAAAWRRLDAFSVFIEGAQEGFTTAVKIIPYLVAMLVAIGLLRASGVLGLVLDALRALVGGFGFDARWVDAVPVMLLKPLSGSGARGMMIETMQAHGVDSFAGRLACIVQGSTETTFYVLAVYFGSVGVRITRHALACALIADAAGFFAAVTVAYAFFG